MSYLAYCAGIERGGRVITAEWRSTWKEATKAQ